MVHTHFSEEFVLNVSEVLKTLNRHGGAPRRAPCVAAPTTTKTVYSVGR
jgi:hypothetical protein